MLFSVTWIEKVYKERSLRWTRPKGKGEVLSLPEHHTVKAFNECGGKSPRTLDLRTRLRWVVRFMLRPHYARANNSGYSFGRRLCGPQGLSGHTVAKRTLCASDGNRFLSYLTTLCQPLWLYSIEWKEVALVYVKVLTWHSLGETEVNHKTLRISSSLCRLDRMYY